MGNCAAPCTSKMAFSEAHGGLEEQPLHLVVDDNKNGQKHKVRTRSRSSENCSSSEQADYCKNTGAATVRVKLVVRKEELAELVGKGLTKQEVMEDLLAKFQAKLRDQSNSVHNPYEQNFGTAEQMSSHRGWTPSLESIPEDMNTKN